MKRYCILTLPRSGSQLCEKILEDNNPHSYRLSEMFEGWYKFDFVLENNRISKIPNLTKNLDRICNDYEYKLNLISNADPSVDYTLRIFLYNHRNLYIQNLIISRLLKSNFTFVSLKRNFEDVVLSNLIAKYYLNKGQNIYAMGTQITKEPIIIPIKENFVYYQISTLFTSYLCWDQRIKTLFGYNKVFNVQYESIYQDCEKILNHKVDVVEGKTLSTNGYDYIINKDEIREIIRPYKELLDKQNG